MNRKTMIKEVKKWMKKYNIKDLKEYDCSESKPEKCTDEELLSVIEDAEEDQAKEINYKLQLQQSIEEDDCEDCNGGYLNEDGN